MNNVFQNNLLSLRQANIIVVLFAGCLSVFPVFFEDYNFVKAGIHLGVAVIALLISFYANYVMQQLNVSNRVVYVLETLFYANVLIFGTYLDIWSKPFSIAALFPCLLICSLLTFVNPPHFNLCLTLGAIIIFIISAVIVNPVDEIIFYIGNSVVAGFLSLFFSWQITKLRLGLEITATNLENERNKYVDQSITDELTQLKNRRDFNQTFHRFLSNYRASDDWLCIALADIDFFKLYNDHYGHPKGDDCLRGIGAALNSLSALGVYAARVGGEEFALLWFEKDPSHVEQVVSQWTETIRNLKIQHEKSKVSEYVTMSIGIYVVRCGSRHDTQELYDLADKALYTAKSSGRNCAIVCGDEIKQYKIVKEDSK
ncbi:MAG: GGDEF domain-containing protein [Treponema sp.]|nr:GGDEF domain-containing protein [Treponema sp.]